MILLLFILLIILSVFGALIVDFQTMSYMWLILLFGNVLSYALNKGKDKIKTVKIYNILFFSGATFMLICYSYMTYHGYNYLFAPDIDSYFLPWTENYINEGSYWNALNEIWQDYNFFNRFHTGYFTYATFFGFIGQMFNANFYVGQQISVLFLYPFVGILIYKLLQTNGFNNEKSFKYTLLISLFSIIFYYSSLILRDIHILLLYLIGIYLTFKKEFSIINLFKIIVVIYINTLFRIETGLFLIVLIPTYLLLTLKTNKYKSIVVGLSFMIFFSMMILFVIYYNQIQFLFESNQEAYTESVMAGSGMIATLQRIPIAGDFASIIYNAAQPLPFWARLQYSGGSLGPEVYNIMNFPQSFAAFFNWIVIIYVMAWLFISKIRRKTKKAISKPLKYHLWVGLIFMLIQSAVVSQRRLMAYYVIYYIFSFIIYNSVSKNDSKYINIVAVGSFVLLQLVGLVYKI